MLKSYKIPNLELFGFIVFIYLERETNSWIKQRQIEKA